MISFTVVMLGWNLTNGSQPQTRQVTPECTCPIRGSGSQTGYPRMHITRQAIPGLNVNNTLDKRGCKTPVQGHQREIGEVGNWIQGRIQKGISRTPLRSYI